MKEVKSCCGCGACVQACPVGCITFEADAEGFEYPQVALEQCTDCGRCERVCPMLHPSEALAPRSAQGVIHADTAVRLGSSSGGVFHALATAVLQDGGIVVGALFDEHHTLCQQAIDDIRQLPQLCGSKYIQSSNRDAFQQVRQALRQQRRVLFVGTPCQVAGLRRFLGQDNALLLTADFFCHGVPSPLLWQRFLEEVLASHRLRHEDISHISFRHKGKGWREYRMMLTLKDGREISIPRSKNAYQRAFDENLSLRPSCHDCPARGGRSHSDLTLADFWDIAQVRPKVDDNKGVSLVLCHTAKGEEALQRPCLQRFDTDLEAALRHNPAYQATHTVPHPQRAHFFAQLPTAESVMQLIEQELHLPLMQRLRKDFNLRKYLLKQHLMRLIK